jgi:hypothetical protein
MNAGTSATATITIGMPRAATAATSAREPLERLLLWLGESERKLGPSWPVQPNRRSSRTERLSAVTSACGSTPVPSREGWVT